MLVNLVINIGDNKEIVIPKDGLGQVDGDIHIITFARCQSTMMVKRLQKCIIVIKCGV